MFIKQYYNQCFGDMHELIQQFDEVRKLNLQYSKPVLHISLSQALEEKLSKAVLSDMVEECGKQLGFENNQYIAIHHIDTDHQHIHIVANRVGFDGKTVKDSHNYQKIASYCRKMELKYELKQVLLPKSKEEKQKLRINMTKEIKPETTEEKHHVEPFKLLEQLMKPEHNIERINPELLKKKKRKKHNLHL